MLSILLQTFPSQNNSNKFSTEEATILNFFIVFKMLLTPKGLFTSIFSSMQVITSNLAVF